MKLEDSEWYPGFYEQHDVKLHSGAGVGMARVAYFIFGQTDIRDCVPFLINRDNVIQDVLRFASRDPSGAGPLPLLDAQHDVEGELVY